MGNLTEKISVGQPVSGARHLCLGLTRSVAGLGMLALGIGAVQAQDRAGAADSAIEEIIVTATKRERQLQDVPVAVSVISGNTIDQAAIRDLTDLQSVVPSLTVTQRGRTGNTVVSIRGFGGGNDNAAIEPSVGVFIDGVYRSKNSQSLGDFMQVERVEVLRGPQSTLFGKNSSAGAISIITKAPEFEPNGKLELTYGNYDQMIARGYVTTGISETVAASIEASYNSRDGYVENTFNGQDLGDRNRWAARGQLLFVPSGDLTVRVIADVDGLDETCCYSAPAIIGRSRAIFDMVGAEPAAGDIFDYETNENTPRSNSISNAGISAQIDWDMGLGVLTSITAFRSHDSDSVGDADYTSLDATIAANNNDRKSFTQELRLSGGGASTAWLLGAFYAHDEDIRKGSITYGADMRALGNALARGGLITAEEHLKSLGALPSDTLFFGENQGVFTNGQVESDSLHLFSNIDFDVTNRLTGTLGAGYTYDKKQLTIATRNTDTLSNLNLVTLGGGQLLGLQALQFLKPVVPIPNAVEDGTKTDTGLTYAVKLAYRVSRRVNLYGSYSTGFKASAANPGRNSRPAVADIETLDAAGLLPDQTAVSLGEYAGTRFTEPERTRLVEFGMKTKFKAGTFNLALFDQDIKNFQTNVFDGVSSILANAGKQKSRGIEAELAISVTDWLQLDFAGTYLDARFEEFMGASGVDGIVDLSGEAVPGFPEFASSSAITLKKALGPAELFARIDWQYESATPVATNVPDSVEKKVSTINVSIGADFDNGWELMLWGRNITSDKVILAGFPSAGQPGTYAVYASVPARYGLTIRREF